jgi:hypothetical protein
MSVSPPASLVCVADRWIAHLRLFLPQDEPLPADTFDALFFAARQRYQVRPSATIMLRFSLPEFCLLSRSWQLFRCWCLQDQAVRTLHALPLIAAVPGPWPEPVVTAADPAAVRCGVGFSGDCFCLR